MEAMEQQGFLVSYTDEIWIRNGKHLNQGKRHRKYSGSIFEHCIPLCIISPSSVVIHREVFQRIGCFDEHLPVCEDYDMWLRISSQYPILFIDRALITKKGGHEDQLSRRYEAMDRFRVEALLKVFKCNPSEKIRLMAAEELSRKCAVLSQGARKRGKLEEAEYYQSLLNRVDIPAKV